MYLHQIDCACVRAITRAPTAYMDGVWAAALLLAGLLALVVGQGFRALKGSAGAQRVRPRGAVPYSRAEEWLLGPAARAACAQV